MASADQRGAAATNATRGTPHSYHARTCYPAACAQHFLLSTLMRIAPLAPPRYLPAAPHPPVGTGRAQTFKRGLIGKEAIVVLLNAVDNELTLLKLNRHTARELMPFRQVARQATPSHTSMHIRLARVLETLSEFFPGRVGEWIEDRAHRLSFRAFQGHYDVAIGYLIAHEELVEEEMRSPSSFALNTIINNRAFEMVQENIKEASFHIARLKRKGNWANMCVILDTVRAAHSLLCAFISSTNALGHHGNIAEGECDRLLDLFTLRGEWLHASGIHQSVNESLPSTMVRQLSRSGRQRQLPLPPRAASSFNLIQPRREAIKLTPQRHSLNAAADEPPLSAGETSVSCSALSLDASPPAVNEKLAAMRRHKSTPASLGVGAAASSGSRAGPVLGKLSEPGVRRCQSMPMAAQRPSDDDVEAASAATPAAASRKSKVGFTPTGESTTAGMYAA